MTIAAEHPGVKRPPATSLPALGISAYDRVASMVMALVVLLGVLVACLFLIWLTSQFIVRAAPVPVVIEDVTGGYEDGVFGESMEIEGPVSEEIARETSLEEPMVQETLEMISDAVATRQADLDDPSLTEDVETGGKGGSRGTGNAPALGSGGGGTGGVRRSQRWIIRFPEGGSLATYARQLDFFRVELGAIGGLNQILYAYNLSKPTPDTRTGPGDQEQRLYSSWQEGSLEQADRQPLTKAGIAVENKVVVQFYPADVENLLATLEAQYLQQRAPGRDIRQVRRTHFGVRPEGQGYAFYVASQTYLIGR